MAEVLSVTAASSYEFDYGSESLPLLREKLHHLHIWKNGACIHIRVGK